MKKTFTILVAAICFATIASAQYRGDGPGGNGYDNNVGLNTRENGYGDRGRNYYFSEREKDMQIARISHEYHERIEAVRFNFYMSHFKKQRIIEGLQFNRDREIHAVMENFYGHGRYHKSYRGHERTNW